MNYLRFVQIRFVEKKNFAPSTYSDGANPSTNRFAGTQQV
jgi:hypothetical protein